MLGFHGKYTYSIDVKGRINIPAKFRKALIPEAADTFIVCRATGGCLHAVPQNFWHSYVAEIIPEGPKTPETVRHKRLLYDTASESTLDAQGRITLMPNQITIAGVTKEVILVGHEQYIEIWDPARYAAYLGDSKDFDSVSFGTNESQQAGL
jgi:MraZ protein